MAQPDLFDPLLPDDQIIASFTGEQKQFYEWSLKNEATLDRLSLEVGDDGFPADMSYVDRAWPDPQVRHRYCVWNQQWTCRLFQRMRRVISQTEFFDKISKTNFGNADERGAFLWMMEMLNTPFCLLGEAEFGGVLTGYGLHPGTVFLSPNLENPSEPQLLPGAFLGVNTDVEIKGNFFEKPGPHKRNRREVESSEESSRSGNSEDEDRGHGFIFVQLGSLIAYTGDWSKARSAKREDILGGSWTSTGFGVVLQLIRGRPGPVWVIYNFHTEDEEGNLIHIPMRLDAKSPEFPHIGRLTDNCKATFTYAKIADRLTQLGEGTRFNFNVQHRTERQIVRVKTFYGVSVCPMARQFVSTAI